MNRTASLRFYEELNEFLPEERRKVRFECILEGDPTVVDLLAMLGVPAGLVELVLAGGDSVDLSHPVRNGESLSFFPVFEALDVRPLLRIRPQPLRCSRFVAGAGLHGLVRYLRLCGFDTLDAGRGEMEAAVRISEMEGRVLLAAEKTFPPGGRVSRAWAIRERKPRRQLAEVLAALDLHGSATPLGRCPRCNTPLGCANGLQHHPIIDGESIKLPLRCPGCGRELCDGPHVRRLRLFLEHVRH